jgi:hypothetical protein
MIRYIGSKVIHAEPFARQGHDGSAEGYTVQYEDGYISWSPKEAFEKAYRPAVGMSFGMALEALKTDLRVARVGWNGRGMFLEMFKPSCTGLIMSKGEVISELPWIGMKTADNKFVPWLASQTDMLSDDWITV